MPTKTTLGKAMDKAHESLLKGFNIALDRYVEAPLGHDKLDPRTISKNMSGSLYSSLVPKGFDSNLIAQKPHKVNPLPKDTGQNPKVAAAGKVVDPTAIESAQGADAVSVDTATGHDYSGSDY